MKASLFSIEGLFQPTGSADMPENEEQPPLKWLFLRKHLGLDAHLDLNILSMRSVTIKPPTRLIVARVIARKPKNTFPTATALAVATREPKTVTPERAFMPDIRGVWSKDGTSLITLYPASVAIMKINIKVKGLT